MAGRLWRLRSAAGRRAVREAVLKRLLGTEYELLELGRFRRSGEIHHWMYDGYSLSRALLDAGFLNPREVSATESRIPNWADIGLDAGDDGRAVKPDSIFVEATKGPPRRRAG
jgi:hypothetical protein